MFPQRWKGGKALFMVIRYCTITFIALQLSSEKVCGFIAIESNSEVATAMTYRELPELLHHQPKGVLSLTVVSLDQR